MHSNLLRKCNKDYEKKTSNSKKRKSPNTWLKWWKISKKHYKMQSKRKSRRRNKRKSRIKSILKRNETLIRRNDSSLIQLMECSQKNQRESWNEFENSSKRNSKGKNTEKNRIWNGKGNLNLSRSKTLDFNLMLKRKLNSKSQTLNRK